MMPNLNELREAVNKTLIRPSDADMATLPDVAVEYICGLEDECNAFRSYIIEHGIALSEEEIFYFIDDWYANDKGSSGDTINRRELAHSLVASQQAKLKGGA